jgi:hypothetical protein
MIVASPAGAADLPADKSRDSDVSKKCIPLSRDLVRRYGDVKRSEVLYAWVSDRGYIWSWEMKVPAERSTHYCVRLLLRDQTDRPFERVTMLCSVTDRGLPTETWMFGNAEIATRLCPVAEDVLTQIDRKGPELETAPANAPAVSRRP